MFFKQKTSYEVRISDWSSDVCSSDLAEPGLQVGGVEREVDLLHRPGVADGVAVHLVELRVAHRAKGEFEARVEQELAVVGGHMLVPVCLSPSPAQRERGWGEGAAFRKTPSSALRAPSPASGRRAVHGRQERVTGRPRSSPDSPASMRSPRSEEHTSELQSLMRISYAVFCLKTKKQI